MIKIKLCAVYMDDESIDHPRLGKTAYCKDELDKSRCHTYLNLYESEDSDKWFTCIEVDQNVSRSGLVLLYEHNNIKMVYKTNVPLTCIKSVNEYLGVSDV